MAKAFLPTADGQSFRYLVDGKFRLEVDNAWREMLVHTHRLRREPFPRR
jgi:hypothetical protein